MVMLILLLISGSIVLTSEDVYLRWNVRSEQLPFHSHRHTDREGEGGEREREKERFR